MPFCEYLDDNATVRDVLAHQAARYAPLENFTHDLMRGSSAVFGSRARADRSLRLRPQCLPVLLWRACRGYGSFWHYARNGRQPD